MSVGNIWPVPHPKFWPDDIRTTTLFALQSVRLLSDIDQVLQRSNEMRIFNDIFVSYPPRIRIDSSQKYSRFLVPNTPDLVAGVKRVLTFHGLDFTRVDIQAHDHKIEITTVRACPDTILIYGEPRALPDSPGT